MYIRTSVFVSFETSTTHPIFNNWNMFLNGPSLHGKEWMSLMHEGRISCISPPFFSLEMSTSKPLWHHNSMLQLTSYVKNFRKITRFCGSYAYEKLRDMWQFCDELIKRCHSGKWTNEIGTLVSVIGLRWEIICDAEHWLSIGKCG